MQEKILVLDFGGQYSLLIARRIRQQHVFAEVRSSCDMTVAQIQREGYKGIVFTGGPGSVYDSVSPRFDPEILRLAIPILGICYGHQLLAWMAGAEVCPAENGSEYGRVTLRHTESALFRHVPPESACWMSHTDAVRSVPAGFTVTASTESCPCAAMADEKRKRYGVQFHPEVTHTEYGIQMLRNFLFSVCDCAGDWTMEDFASTSIETLRWELSGKRVLCALSGGVDSAVAAVLLHRAIGDDLTCVFVDHGLLRKGEREQVEQVFGCRFRMRMVVVDARERFLARLKGVTDPEGKRKIIGEEFIRVFEEEAKKLGKQDVLVQGTIYPDVVESGGGSAAVIKSHHNVGGLPGRIGFSGIVEPLRMLFKDEVRAVGLGLGIPEELVMRQPFPGPGLAVRVMGEITEKKLRVLREADAILCEEVAKAGPFNVPSQYFAVLTDTRSVGVMGDGRTYGWAVALRAVDTDDFMTADWARLPYELLEKVSSRITNEVRSVSRVVYDITSKPPATVEWE